MRNTSFVRLVLSETDIIAFDDLIFSMWEEIVAELHYSVRIAQRLHAKALEEVQGILDEWE